MSKSRNLALDPGIFKILKYFVKATSTIFKSNRGLFYSFFFSHGFKRALNSNVFAIFTYFLETITLTKLFLRDSQFWKMADFFLDWFALILFWSKHLKTVEIGHTHNFKRVHCLTARMSKIRT
jgi:hypothetical protein